MMKLLLLTTSVLLTLLSTLASAKDVQFPQEDPVLSVNVPGKWSPKEQEGYLQCTSDDNVASLFFQVISSNKEAEKVSREFFVWLRKEQHVTVDENSAKDATTELGGRKWEATAYDAESKEYGPAKVGFWIAPLSGDKMVMMTFWVSRDNNDKSIEIITTQILPSVKPVE